MIRFFCMFASLAIPVAASASEPAQPATPVGNSGTWVTSDDYPMEAMRQEIEGATSFRLDIDRDGIASIAERAIRIATSGTGGVHVSFDLDVCDPSVAPGVGTPVRGGLSYREAHMIMELVADAQCLISMDLVEVNPTLDIRNTTAEFATELALSALGKNIL